VFPRVKDGRSDGGCWSWVENGIGVEVVGLVVATNISRSEAAPHIIYHPWL